MKNKKSFMAIIFMMLIVLSVVLSFSACEKNKGDGSGIIVLPDETGDVTEVTFTVTFNSTGGSAVSPVTAKVGEKISAPSSPKKNGYTFGGWYTSPECYNTWDFSSDIVTANTTLYAKWTLNTDFFIDDTAFSVKTEGEKVYFYSTSAATDSIILTGKINLKENVYRYTFYADKECTEQVCEIDTAVLDLSYGDNVYYVKITDSSSNEIKTIKFVVKRNSIFSVSYYALDGLLLNTYEYEEGTTIAEPEDYEVIGYDILWQADDGSDWTFGANGRKVTGNVGLHAVSEVKKFKVYLDVNGGNESFSPVTVGYGSFFILPLPTRTGSGFVGWYTQEGVQITASNGVSVSVWNIQSEITLVARWSENIVYLEHHLILDNLPVGESEQYAVSYGGKTSVSANTTDYVGFNGTGYDYTFYVFGGWYDSANNIVSLARTYTTANMTVDSDIYEKWYSITVKQSEGEELIDQKLIVESEDFTNYSNVTLGTDVLIGVDCICGKHSFVRWSTGEINMSFHFDTESVLNNAPYVLETEWITYYVNCEIFYNDEQITDASPLYDTLKNSITGDGEVRKGERANLNVTSQATHTFMGWYISGEKKSGGFDYSFVMTDTITLQAKWYDISELYKINSEDISIGDVDVAAADPENNVVGGALLMNVQVAKGYIFAGLFLGAGRVDVVTSSDMTRAIPEEPVEYTAKFYKNNIKIKSNINNAGKISYKINSGETTPGTYYGGDFVLNEMIYGDDITLISDTYDGYVWLGWYKDDVLLENSNVLVLYEIDPDEALAGERITACWKPQRYDVNLTAGVFTLVNNVTYVGKDDKYYTYDKVTALFDLCDEEWELGAPDEDESYYVFSDNTYTGGSQSVKGYLNDYSTETGEYIHIYATINNRYRFEGWFDENGNRLTIERDYTFNVKDMREEYKAVYTRIPDNYEIKVDIFQGTDDESTPAGAGSVSVYSYYVYDEEDSRYEEICNIDALTMKYNVLTMGGGYNFFGLFSVSGDITWASFQTGLQMPYNNAFDPDIFGYKYLYNITEIKEAEVSYDLMAVWRKGGPSNSFYVAATITSDVEEAGEIYYMAYNSARLNLLVKPNNGYEFLGWYEDNDSGEDSIISEKYSHTIIGGYTGKRYVAKWAKINNETNSLKIAIAGDDLREEGSYIFEATKSGENNDDIITLTAETNDGYIFLGWYLYGDIVESSSKLSLKRKYIEEEEKLAFINDSNEEIILNYEEFVFEPRWKKTDASIKVESVGKTIITGFTGKDGKIYYVLKTYSEFDFEDNGNAWYKTYYFEGWFDKNDVRISNDYVLIVSEDEVLDYYKAVWRNINVEISINTLDEEINPFYSSEGGIASYGYSLKKETSVENEEIVERTVVWLTLYAKPNNRFIFMGWTQNGRDEEDDLNLVYPRTRFGQINEFSLDKINVTGLDYAITFLLIDGKYYPTAELDIVRERLTAPMIIGYRYSVSEGGVKTYHNRYVATARDLDGYIFVGWRSPTSDVIFQREKELVFEDDTYGSGDEPAIPIAIYRKIYNEYPSFEVKVNEKRFENDVSYYAYYNSNNEIILEINTDIPEGYGVSVASRTQGTKFGAELSDFSKVIIPIDQVKNDILDVRFGLLCEMTDTDFHIETCEQVNDVIYSITGRYTNAENRFYNEYLRSDGDRMVFYNEKWTVNTQHNVIANDQSSKPEYSFIGWFSNDKLLSVDQSYELDAQRANVSFKTKYGIYRVRLINDNTEAGDVYIEGYDVTITFLSNVSDETLRQNLNGISIPSQTLNVGDTISYPTQYVGIRLGDYVFGGWYDNPQCSGEQFDFNSDIKCDMILYAKWINAADYDTTVDKFLFISGERINFTTSAEGDYFYFVALSDETYSLEFGNSSVSQVTEIYIGEAKEGGGFSGEASYYKSIMDDKEVSVRYGVKESVVYCIYVKAKTNADEKSFMTALKGEMPVATGQRFNVVSSSDPFISVARPVSYNLENELAVYRFNGWYIGDVLVSEAEELNVTFNGESKNYNIYNMEMLLPTNRYSVYADSDMVINLTAKWIKYNLEIISSDSTGGRISVDFMDVETLGGDIPNEIFDYYGQKTFLWAMTVRPAANLGYNFAGLYRYDEESNSFGEDPVLFPQSGEEDKPTVYYFVLNENDSDLILQCLWHYVRNESENYTIKYNMNTAGAVNSRYNVSGFSSATSEIITLYDPYKFSYDSENKINGYYVFEGWYSDSLLTKKITYINPKEHHSNVEIYAKWNNYPIKNVEIMTDAYGIKYFTLGSFPQKVDTEVTDAEYVGNGLYYSESSKAYYKREQTDGVYYYFKIEPIRWDIINEGDEVIAITHDVIDVGLYNNSTARDGELYSNNWANSSLRKYINDDFLSNFTDTELNFLSSATENNEKISNGPEEGNPAFNSLLWSVQEDTNDIFFVLSYGELVDFRNGFSSNASISDENRVATYSDYAKYLLGIFGEDNDGGYFTRSVGSLSSKVYYVSADGVLDEMKVNEKCGIRIAVKLDPAYFSGGANE